jgi:hypothetical protein
MALKTAEVQPRTALPTGYRGVSGKLPTGLTALGGALLIGGGLGLHLRVTRVLAEGQPPVDVLRVFGASGRPGWIIAVAGAAAIASALAWRGRSLTWLPAPLAASALGIGLAIWRLRVLDQRAAALVARETPSPDFVSFQAGFGWGAWLLLVGAVLLGLGALAGILRTADVRRGLA